MRFVEEPFVGSVKRNWHNIGDLELKSLSLVFGKLGIYMSHISLMQANADVALFILAWTSMSVPP